MSIFKLLLAYDFDRPEDDILCDLIYQSTQYQLNPSVVKFGIPKELDQRPDIDTDQNTYIPAQVDPDFDARLKDGETGFLYTRFPLSALASTGSAITSLAFPFKAHDILTQINAQLGVRLSVNDIENTEYYSLDDDFVIYAKADSKLWTGSCFLRVSGGGKKNLLFPNSWLYAYLNPADLLADKKAQLTALANVANGSSWAQTTDFEFKQIEKVTQGVPGRNTRIFVKSKRVGYLDQWLYYARLNPSTILDLFDGGVLPLVAVPAEAYTVHGILSLINDDLGLHLSTDDVENASYAAGTEKITLVFKATSLGWLQGSLTIKLRFERGQQLRITGDGNWRSSSEGVARVTA